MALDITEYKVLEKVYDLLSDHVFSKVLGRPLPECPITLQRHSRAYGYFSRNRFIQRRDGQRTTHEIALNPDLFPGRSDKEILSTLAHEAVHAFQYEYGTPGRRRYHNTEWSRWMLQIGLTPSATGKPGRKKTGERMSHYIVPGGPFELTIESLLATGVSLIWEDAFSSVSRRTAGDTGESRRLSSKCRFSCRDCGQNAWAKPTAQLLCGHCKVPMRL